MKNIYDADENDNDQSFLIGLRNALLMSLMIFGGVGLIAWSILG
jgi:hypothetical protein